MRHPHIIALLASLPVTLGAQLGDTSAVPRELATALVSTSDYSSSRARIVVSTFPTLGMSTMVPRGGRVLGGLVFEDRRGNANRFTGLLAYRESPDSVATLLEQQMEKAGLKLPSIDFMYGGMGAGFLPSMSSGVGRERPLMFCGDSMHVTATVNEYQNGSLLRLTTSSMMQNSICSAQRDMRLRMVGPASDRIALPTLRPPSGATGGPQGSSGSSGGMDRRNSSAAYAARHTIAEMLDHYAQQLKEQGWTLGKRLVDDEVGMLVARKVDTGDTQFLMLTDYMPNPRQHELELSVIVPSRRP